MLKEYAQRLRAVRSQLNLGRDEFAKLCSININTLKSLELGNNKLTPGNAYTISEAATKNGLVCTPEWLVFGAGILPYFKNKGNEQHIQTAITSLENVIKEADFFVSTNSPNAEIKVIQDGGMLPLFRTGDYVGAIRQEINFSTLQTNNDIYIIETENKSYIRKISTIDDNMENKKLLLIPLNTAEYRYHEVSSDSIKSTMLVVWHRKLTNTGP